jgi:drug/metabolite transporter (DMT)-like permease
LVTAAQTGKPKRSRKDDRRDLALALTGAFAFGCTILFSRTVARDQLASSVALGIRFGVAGLILFGVLAAMRAPLLPPPGERIIALSLGLCIYAIESTLFYMGLERGTAAAVALIFYVYPAVIALFETVTGAIRLRARTLVALALSVSGSAVVAIGGGEVAISRTGVLCVLGSVVMFSAYALLSNRVVPRTDSLTAAAWTAIGASLGVTLFGAARGQLSVPSGGAFAALVGNGFATAAAFSLFFVVLDRIGPTRTGICMAFEAVTGIALAAIFLGENVRPVVAIGGAAVLVGAVLAALVSPAPIEAVERSSSP